MKNLSSLITENEQTKKYKYTATVIVEGEVTAMSEGDAGELADKELDTIEGFVSGQIDDLSVVESEIKESVIGANAQEQADSVFEEIIEFITVKTEKFTDYHKAMIYAKLKQFIDKK